jgi:hypothetical protein
MKWKQSGKKGKTKRKGIQQIREKKMRVRTEQQVED